MVKIYDSNGKIKVWMGILGTIFFTIIVFLFISHGNLNFGLYDDNQAQWLPIIDRAFQSFLDTGRLPTIDFFQMKGMKIYDQGYYGLWNPFMLVAYLVRTYVLFFLDTNTISVYIFIMILLGNLCCYGIFHKFEISMPVSVCLSICMMSVSVYVALSYWYYIYNVYFILSWLLFCIVRQEDKREYYEYGIILSLSLFMGNIQYTVYMFLAFTCIMFVLFLRGNRKVIGKLLSNCVCLGICSFVPLLLLLQASSRTINFSGDNAEYYSSAVHPLVVAIFSWFPSVFLEEMAGKIEGFFYENISLPDTGFFPGARSMYMGAMVCAVVVFLVCRRSYKKDRLYEVTCGCLITAGIFLLMSFGKIGILAIFARQIPFVNSFRIIAKFYVLVPLLFVPCVAAVAREQGKQKKLWNLYVAFFLIFFLFGILHNSQIAFGTSQIRTDEGIKRLQELEVDYHNYRIQGFASWQEIQVSYPQWQEFSQRERISYEEKFSKNAGTVAGVITQGGYDLAFDYKQYEMSNSLLGTMSGYASEFGYDNMVIEEYFLEKYRQDNADYWANLKKLQEQIADNAVKYYIFTKDSACYSVFLQLLDNMHMSVEWQQDFLDHTVILSVADIPPIVQTKDGGKAEAQITMDQIAFPSSGDREFRVAMYYDENLCAHYIGQSGEKTALSILPDEKGYYIISGIPESGYGMVEIGYYNHLYMIGIIWNAVIFIVMIIVLLMPEIGSVEKVVKYVESKIKSLGRYIARIRPYRSIKGCFIALLCFYMVFMGVYYFHTACTVPDEDWFLQMFQTIHHKAGTDIFAYLAETENYLGYGQIYWIVGGILPHILPLRVMMYIMLMCSMLFTLKEIKYYYGKQMIPYAGILWISMPYAWYVNKCIGPEILGLFFGILGLNILKKRKVSWVGWILLGISSAIKMNYAVFLLMAFIEMLWCGKKDRAVTVIKGGVLSVCGFVLANPIILWDLRRYIENMELGGGMLPEALVYVFERRECEWDSVTVNGVFWGYVSAFLLFIAILAWMIQKTYYEKTDQGVFPWQKNRFYGNLAGCISVILVCICCREIFLGWYLLPLCYFAVIFICSRFYYRGEDKQTRNFLYWTFATCLFINLLILLPEHISQRENNIAYMRMEANRNAIEKETTEIKVDLEQKRPDTQWYYLLDFHMGEYSYNFNDYADFCVSNVEGIAVIGERMRCITAIDDIVEKADKREENLEVLWQNGDVWIVERNRNKNG